MNNKMSKTGKTKSLLQIIQFGCIRVYGWKWYQKWNRALCNCWWTEKGREKRSCKFCFISLNKSIKWLTWKYPEVGVWKQKSFLLKTNPREVIHEHSHGKCTYSSSGKWLNCALEVFQENNIYPPYFSTAVFILCWNR